MTTHFLVFLFLLVSICWRNSEAQHCPVIVASPSNGSVFYKTVFLSLSVEWPSMLLNGYSAHGSLDNAQFALRLSVNGKLINFRESSKSNFEYTLSDGVFDGEGKLNELLIEAFISSPSFQDGGDNESNRSCGHTKLHLTSLKSNTNKNFESIVSLTRGGAVGHYSFLLLGAPADSELQLFAHLEAFRLEVLPALALASSSSTCGRTYGFGARIVHCLLGVEAIMNIIFVDHAFLWLESIILLAESRRRIGASTFTTPEAIITRAVQLTRGKVWLFAPLPSSSSAHIVLSSALGAIRFQQAFFNKEIITGEFEQDEVVWQQQQHGTLMGAWVWSASDTPSSDGELSHFLGFDYISRGLRVNENNNESENDETVVNPTAEGTGTEVLAENYEAGRAFILLSNVCLTDEASRVVLFNKDLTVANSAEGPTLINMTYLAKEEDRGFLYTGLKVQEMHAFDARAVQMRASWPWVRGMTALSLSVSAGHLIHEVNIQF